MLKGKRSRFLPGLLAISILLIAAAVLFVVFRRTPPERLFDIGRCAFSVKTHLYCPGCGGTRAINALVHGDIIDSLLSNPIPVYAVALAVRMWIALLHNTLSAKKEWTVLHDAEAWGILAVVLGFFILRNILLIVFHIDYLGDMIS